MANWLTVTPTTGSGETNVICRAETYTGRKSRSATLKFTPTNVDFANLEVRRTVTQEGQEILKGDYEFDSGLSFRNFEKKGTNGETVYISILSNLDGVKITNMFCDTDGYEGLLRVGTIGAQDGVYKVGTGASDVIAEFGKKLSENAKIGDIGATRSYTINLPIYLGSNPTDHGIIYRFNVSALDSKHNVEVTITLGAGDAFLNVQEGSFSLGADGKGTVTIGTNSNTEWRISTIYKSNV